MQSLKFIGRGSAFNREEGNNSAYIKKENSFLLIDCGELIYDEIEKRKLITEDIKEINILITHLHGDHAGSLSSFIFWCYFKLNIVPNVVYRDVRAMEEYLTLQGTVKNIHYNLINGRKVKLENMNINLKSVEVEHCHVYKNMVDNTVIYEKPKENSELYKKVFRSYAYYIDVDDKKIYYSGDSGEFNLDIEKINELDEIYHDCSSYDIEGFPHIGLNTLAKKIDSKYREKVYLMHFDSDELILKGKKLGFNIVKLEPYDSAK